MYICGVTGLYVGPDKCHPDDLEVPDRPSPDHKWENGVWVMDEVGSRAAEKKATIDVVQAIMDTKAQEYGYDHILSAASYATSSDTVFAKEGEAFKAWRDKVWIYCRETDAAIEAGTLIMSTIEEFIAGMPAFVPPT